MEENVALDSTKKRKFLKSIKSIKRLINKNDKKQEVENSIVEEKKKPKRAKPERGLVYLSHIPHGFYEHQMTEYFKQFGAVTNARVIRSKRTGRSKGFAFVEFREPSVAQIVAETMNNYLMGKRLIKAAYIPPKKIRRHAMRKNWSEVHNPVALERMKQKKAFNAVKSESEELKKAKKMLSNLEKTKKKLLGLGISYDFMPVDIPLELIKVKQEKEEEQNVVKEETDVKLTKKEKKKGKENDNNKKPVEEKKQPVKTEKEVKPKNEPKSNKGKKDKPEIKVDKKEQEQKQKKLDKAGVKSVENFIKVQESDNDSDSSADFDSDEYEKMLSDESDLGSDENEDTGDESGDEDEDDDDDDEDDDDDDDDDDVDDDDEVENSDSSEEESVVDYPPVRPKQKVPLVVAPKTSKKQEQVNKNTQVKRKAPQKATVSPKKPKFEKQNKPIPVKKQFKKKK